MLSFDVIENLIVTSARLVLCSCLYVYASIFLVFMEIFLCKTCNSKVDLNKKYNFHLLVTLFDKCVLIFIYGKSLIVLKCCLITMLWKGLMNKSNKIEILNRKGTGDLFNSISLFDTIIAKRSKS